LCGRIATTLSCDDVLSLAARCDALACCAARWELFPAPVVSRFTGKIMDVELRQWRYKPLIMKWWLGLSVGLMVGSLVYMLLFVFRLYVYVLVVVAFVTGLSVCVLAVVAFVARSVRMRACSRRLHGRVCSCSELRPSAKCLGRGGPSQLSCAPCAGFRREKQRKA
jgi:hypothetical protein